MELQDYTDLDIVDSDQSRSQAMSTVLSLVPRPCRLLLVSFPGHVDCYVYQERMMMSCRTSLHNKNDVCTHITSFQSLIDDHTLVPYTQKDQDIKICGNLVS